jgi:hypothetical protein
MGYSTTDSVTTAQAAAARLRQEARGKTMVGFVGNVAGLSDADGTRAASIDVARHMDIKRGRVVLARPGERGVDISAPLRQLGAEAEPIRTLYANRAELRAQFKAELAGQVVSFSDDLDPALAREMVAILNEP